MSSYFFSVIENLRFLSKFTFLSCSDADKAHLRLAAAKGVLRLARRWDSQIPIDVFHMVVMTVQVCFIQFLDSLGCSQASSVKNFHWLIREQFVGEMHWLNL